MSFRTDLYELVDSVRSIAGPDVFDDTINQLTIRTRTWSGPRVGMGTSSDSDLVLPAYYPISLLESQRISSSAGLYEQGDILVDHITPSNGAGVGYTEEQLAPTVSSDNVEVLYLISGDSLGNGHPGEYRCVECRTYEAFSSQLVLRRTPV